MENGGKGTGNVSLTLVIFAFMVYENNMKRSGMYRMPGIFTVYVLATNYYTFLLLSGELLWQIVYQLAASRTGACFCP